MRNFAKPYVFACLFLNVILAATSRARADDLEVRGRVVDEAGNPIADATVGYFWRANGSTKDADGKPYDLTKEENVSAFWGRLGEMEPMSESPPIKTGSDGRFMMKSVPPYFTLMAMDRSRRLGGLAIPAMGEEGLSVEIRLAPLARVRGSFEGPGSGQKPYWTHVYVHLPDDPTHPIDSTRLVSCGSFEAEFDFRLPPGSYTLQGYSMFADKEQFEGELIPNREIVLKGDVLDVDLGRLTLQPYRRQLSSMIEQSKSAGSWGNFREHFGEEPPRWHITDARGVGKDVQPSDFRGKWVLVDFWGFGCRPCLKSDLPNLMKFHEDHAAQRDRFEILAFCVDPDGELKSMAGVDRQLAPIVKHVWGGKTLPFPVLLDSTFQTWERFGLLGMGEVLLINPEGKLVEGDASVLAEKLKELR